MDLGHLAIWAIKQNTGAWGSAPVDLNGAHGFYAISDDIDPGVELLRSGGVSGVPWRREGQLVLGAKKPAGSIVAPLYYQDYLWRAIAAAIGADAVTTPATNVKLHSMTLQTSHTGKFLTLAEFGADRVRELNTAKILGFRIELSESGEGQIARVTIRLASEQLYINQGAADDDYVVASVAAANGALTILSAASDTKGFNPSPLFMTKDAGVTALTVTINAERWDGKMITLTFTASDFVSNVWTGTDYIRRVISASLASVSGTGNVKIGVTNGVNKTGTSPTFESNRDLVVWSHADVYLLPQLNTAAFAAADLHAVSQLSVDVDLSMDQRVTALRGRTIDQPSTGGADFIKVMAGFNFSAETSQEQALAIANQHKKLSYKMLIDLKGPQIGTTDYPHRLKIWLNALKFERGFSQLSGPGQRALDFGGEATAVSAVSGSDWPSGKTQPVFIELWNGDGTAYLT